MGSWTLFSDNTVRTWDDIAAKEDHSEFADARQAWFSIGLSVLVIRCQSKRHVWLWHNPEAENVVSSWKVGCVAVTQGGIQSETFGMWILDHHACWTFDTQF